MRRLQKALLNWAVRYHACVDGVIVDWLLQTALKTLEAWRRSLGRIEEVWIRDREEPGKLHTEKRYLWALGLMGLPAPLIEDYVFKSRGWNPAVETRREAELRIRQDLRGYLDRQEATVRGHGWEPTPEKRNPAHLEWFVRYQVEGLSIQKLANQYPRSGRPPNRISVRGAIRDVEERIGWPLRRRLPGGRPRHVT
jgi:hypothetical protein